MKHITQDGQTTYRANCHECGCVFTYQREDVNRNYVRGGEWVSCPSCGHACRHFGASGTEWPDCGRRGRHGGLVLFPHPTRYTHTLPGCEEMRSPREE